MCKSESSSGGCCGGGEPTEIKVGKRVPRFSLEAYAEGQFKKVSLNDFSGKWVVLFFYPLDFTFVCPTEIKGFAQHITEFAKLNAQVLTCSTDSVHAHKAWSENSLGAVPYPMLADQTHEVSEAYGVLNGKGVAMRGTFIIDPEGVLRYQVVSDMNVGRSVKETLRVLAAVQTGEKCPVEWEAGTATLGK